MSQGRLLIVDDNEMNCDMLSRRLARKGYEVAVANDGYRALELLRDQTFDLILLDIMMPGMSGLQVLERIRQKHTLTELPVLMATAKVDSEYVVQALSMGANDYVTKPIDFPVVLARIETQLHVKQALKEQVLQEASTSAAGRMLRTTGEFHKLDGSDKPLKLAATHFCDSCASALIQDPDRCPHCDASRPLEGWLPIEDADFPFLGETIGERYFLEGYVGSGTDGIVYRARDIDLQRQFAAKIINTEEGYSGLDPDKMRARVKLEVEAMVRLKNPHVVKIYEVVQVNATVFALVMDYVQGTTLGTLLAEQSNLRPELALDVARQVAQGLYEAHQNGMIHRDIKPDNIMLEQLPAGGYFARVLDFGIVAILDRPTGSASFYGTPLYTSPEQILDGQLVDHRADIYALGAVLYHLLSGRPPFVDDSVAKILNLHVKGALPRLTLPFIPNTAEDGINGLLAHMMAKSIEARPRDLSEVINTIDEVQRLIPRTESGRFKRLARPAGTSEEALPVAAVSSNPAQATPPETASTYVDARSPYIHPLTQPMAWARPLVIRPHLAGTGLAAISDPTPDGSHLHLIDVATGVIAKTVALVKAEVAAVAVASSAKLVAIADARTRQLCIVDPLNRGVTHNWAIPGPGITAVAISADGTLAAAGTQDGHLFVASTTHRRQAYKVGLPGTPVTALAISERQTEIAVAYTDGTIEIFPLVARGQRASLQRLHAVPIALSFNAACDTVAALTATTDVATFLTTGGARLAHVSFGDTPLTGIAFDPQSRLIGLVAESEQLRLWDLSGVFA